MWNAPSSVLPPPGAAASPQHPNPPPPRRPGAGPLSRPDPAQHALDHRRSRTPRPLPHRRPRHNRRLARAPPPHPRPLPPTHRHNPNRRVAALASRHRDGQLIAGILARFGVRAIHGSTTRLKPGSTRAKPAGGAAGLRNLIAALANGDAIVITPDGPRGPPRTAAPGTTQLAALTGAPIIAVAGAVRPRITLKSWDRMVLPLPFGRGALVCLPPVTIPPEPPPTALTTLTQALTQAADRAEALCPA